MNTTPVDFFFDFVSPYSYLASTQLRRLERDFGARFRYRPIFLGALLKSLGAQAPLTRPGWAGFMLKDLHRWSKSFDDGSDVVSVTLATDASSNVYATGFLHGNVDFGGGPVTSSIPEDVFLASF